MRTSSGITFLVCRCTGQNTSQYGIKKEATSMLHVRIILLIHHHESESKPPHFLKSPPTAPPPSLRRIYNSALLVYVELRDKSDSLAYGAVPLLVMCRLAIMTNLLYLLSHPANRYKASLMSQKQQQHHAHMRSRGKAIDSVYSGWIYYFLLQGTLFSWRIQSSTRSYTDNDHVSAMSKSVSAS